MYKSVKKTTQWNKIIHWNVYTFTLLVIIFCLVIIIKLRSQNYLVRLKMIKAKVRVLKVWQKPTREPAISFTWRLRPNSCYWEISIPYTSLSWLRPLLDVQQTTQDDKLLWYVCRKESIIYYGKGFKRLQNVLQSMVWVTCTQNKISRS